MKAITLKTEQGFDYRELLLAIVKAPLAGGAQGGTNIDAMRRDIRLLDLLEPAAADAVLTLEDADWNHLVQKVRAFPFAVSDRRVLAMCDAVLTAEQAEPSR